MKVRCERIFYPPTGQPRREVASHRSISIGEEYVVLSINADAHRGVTLQLVTRPNQNPSLWSADMFVVTDPRLPSNWRVQMEDGMNLAPAAWQEPSFWEGFWEADAVTPEERRAIRASYERGLAIILQEASAS
jgi:hypothetical protein